MNEHIQSKVNKAFLLQLIENQTNKLHVIEVRLENLETERMSLGGERESILEKRRIIEALLEEYFEEASTVNIEQQPFLPTEQLSNNLSIPEMCMRLIYDRGNNYIEHIELVQMIRDAGKNIHAYSVNGSIRRSKEFFESITITKRRRSRLTEAGIAKAREEAFKIKS